MESRWVGILASTFNAFWWGFGSKLGGNMEPSSIPEGTEKSGGKMEGAKTATRCEQEVLRRGESMGPRALWRGSGER